MFSTRPERRPALAMVTDSIQPFNAGGKEVRYAELARELTSRFDVTVYTMKWWRGPTSIVDGGIRMRAVCPRIPLYAGGRRSIPQAVVFALGCLRLLGGRFDVIEADHMPYLQIFVLRLIAWAKGVRLVVTWHEVWGRDYWRSYLGPLGLLAYSVEAAAMKLPDAIVAASEQTASRLQTILGQGAAVTVAPNGVDLQRIRSADPSEQAVDVVTVGRLMPHKRVDLLLDAVAVIRSRTGRELTIRVIGTGTAEAGLREHAERSGVADLVEFRTDVTDNAEVYSLMKSASVFVLPSEREGFGIVALEAIACGLPVVTTSAPDNLAQHLVRQVDTGIVCAPDVDALAESIVAGIDRTAARSGDLAQDERWLEPYSWPIIAQQVAAVLHHPADDRTTTSGTVA